MIYLPDIPNDAELNSFYRRYDEFKTGLREVARWWNRYLPIPPNPHLEILRRMGGLEGKRLCEIGCASGSFLLLARRAGAVVSGIELNERDLATLARRGIAAASRLDLGQRFDIVCAFNLIEHLARPGDWLSEVHHVLVPDGRLLLVLPNAGEVTRVGTVWVGFRVDLEHLNYFSVGTLARLLHQSGLYVEHFWESGQPNIDRAGDTGMPRSLLSRLATRLSRMNEGTFTLTVLARRGPG